MFRHPPAGSDSPFVAVPSGRGFDRYRDLPDDSAGYNSAPPASFETMSRAYARRGGATEAYAFPDPFQDGSAGVAPMLPPRQDGRSAKNKKKKKKKQSQRMSIVPNLKLMSNSERGKYYRRRKKMYTEELERDVAELREQVAALSISRQVQSELALSATRTPLGSSARLVVEYCQQFALGAPVRLAINESDATAALVSKATATQESFLRAVMESDLRFGEFEGIDLLLGQWERYSIYHSSIHWTLKTLEVARTSDTDYADDDEFESAPVVIAIYADLTVRFSRRTIEEVFPHLLSDEQLIQELVGLEVTYPCINHFHFNHHGKIEWYNPEVDFVAALMNALGSIERVNRVLGHALIAKDHMIGEIEPELQVEVAVPQFEELESKVVHVVKNNDDDDVGTTLTGSTNVVTDVGDNQDEEMGGSDPAEDDASPLRRQMDLAFILS